MKKYKKISTIFLSFLVVYTLVYFKGYVSEKEKLIGYKEGITKENYNIDLHDEDKYKDICNLLIIEYDKYFERIESNINSRNLSIKKKYFINNEGEAVVEVVDYGNIDVDHAEYANLLAKAFVFDFFNWSDKTSSSDIGGIQFVFSPLQSQFFKNATKTYYLNFYSIKEHSEQSPVVKNVELLQIEPSFSILIVDEEEVEYAGYTATLHIEYDSENEFLKEVTIDIVEYNENLYVIAVEGE